MDGQKAKEIAKNLLQYLWDNGWNKTLKLVKEMQAKDAASAKMVVKCFEDLVVASKNYDFMYYFARDIDGANIETLLFWINYRLKEDPEFFGPDKKEVEKLTKYARELEKRKQTRRLTSSDILSQFDDN